MRRFSCQPAAAGTQAGARIAMAGRGEFLPKRGREIFSQRALFAQGEGKSSQEVPGMGADVAVRL